MIYSGEYPTSHFFNVKNWRRECERLQIKEPLIYCTAVQFYSCTIKYSYTLIIKSYYMNRQDTIHTNRFQTLELSS